MFFLAFAAEANNHANATSRRRLIQALRIGERFVQFTDQEQAMIAVLRRQRDSWPALRMFMALMSVILIAVGFWEAYSASWSAIPLILLIVGVMTASHTYRNWHGPPEASLLLKLIDHAEHGPNA